MDKQNEELIAVVLGDVKPSPQMKRRLDSEKGRREAEAYRRTLTMLNAVYAGVAAMPRRVAHYTTIRTPVGRLLVAATEAGLVRVSFDANETQFVADLKRRMRIDVVESREKLSGVVAQLEAYFAGQRRRFDVPIDDRAMTPFQRKVLTAAVEIPAGRIVTYGELAKRIGQPKAGRAVGQALGHNPMPIVIPCHRVVAGGGGLGGYIGGLKAKEWLLRLEGAQ